MGRQAVEEQAFNDNPFRRYQVNYTYNLLGLPATSTNSQGVTLTYTYNRGARLTLMTSSLSDAVHPGTLFSGAHYNAYGELVSDSLGNGVNETFSYDVRGRLLSANATKSSTTVYSLGGPGSGNVMTYAHGGKQFVAVLSGVGGWAGIGMAAGLTKDTDGLGAVGAYKALANYTQLGGVLTVFALPD